MSNVITSRLVVRRPDGQAVDRATRVAMLEHLCAESSAGGSYWVQPLHRWDNDAGHAELRFGSGKCWGVDTLPEAFPGHVVWHRVSDEGVSWDDLERVWPDPDAHPQESRWCTLGFDEVRLVTSLPRHELPLNGRIEAVEGGLSAPLLGTFHVGTARFDDVGPACTDLLEGAEEDAIDEAELSVVSHPSVDRLCQETPETIEAVELRWRGSVVAAGRGGVFRAVARWGHVVDPWYRGALG